MLPMCQTLKDLSMFFAPNLQNLKALEHPENTQNGSIRE